MMKNRCWKVAVIVLMALLTAGPVALSPHTVAADTPDVQAARTALEAARKMRAMLVEAVEGAGRKFDEVSFEEASVLAEARFGTLVSAGSYTPPKLSGPYKGSGVGPSPAYSYSACVVDVDVDPRTGLITVNKVWIAHDVGRAINPLLVEGQVEGSV